MKSRYILVLAFTILLGGACGGYGQQLGNYRASYMYQYGLQADGTPTYPNIPEIPWSKYTQIIQCSIFPRCVNPGDTPTVNSDKLDSMVTGWGKTFSRKFTTDAHAAGKKALVSLFGTGGQDWQNACADTTQSTQFANALLAYVNANEYDGIDIDYEAGVPDSITQTTIFMQILHSLFKNTALTWNHQPLTITFATGVVYRQLNSMIQGYVDSFHEMTYDQCWSDYNGNSGTHAWHNSAVRRDTTYAGPYSGYGDYRNMKSMDENIWWETMWFSTSYSKFAVGIPFFGSWVQCPLQGDSVKGISNLSDVCDLTDPNRPKIKANVLYRYFFNPVPYGTNPNIYTDTFTNSSLNTPFWDDVTKASWIRHNTNHLGTYNDQSIYGKIYLYNDGMNRLGDAFFTYPSVRFIQESVKWAREQRSYPGTQTPPGYLGGVFSFEVLSDFLPSQAGDARWPLSTALAEAMDLNAWTYSAPVCDNDVTCWWQSTATNTIESVYDNTRCRRVTKITPPSSGSSTDVYVLNQPGGTHNINDTARYRYIRFAVKTTWTKIFVLVHTSTGSDYWLEYQPGTGNPVKTGNEIVFYISNMADGGWHGHARDLQADLNAGGVYNTTITRISQIKIRPYVNNTVFLDDFTLFTSAPPLGDNQ